MRQEDRTRILQKIDTSYSYGLAKRMEQYRTNEVLGYRSAGSEAEFLTGEMLKQEMERIGLSKVTKDAITADRWEFKKAVLEYRTEAGERRTVQLGAYQTTMVTDGFQEFSLVYLGKGTEQEYEGKDVTGKLVLAEINQRDEWWINYPVYQAHRKGAAALIAVQSGGYGEIDDEALNAQDIAGPENAPAFSISRKDARELCLLLKKQGELRVRLDCDTRVERNQTTYNITGCIPGRHPERIVLLSAHYDSYFSGFQDDNTAVAMMLGIAKALLDSGYQPQNTVLICAMAAEEWGVADSNFDWSTGAYEQVFTAHPEWVGKVIADLNFELPALAHGTRARIRSCYEYVEFLEEYLTDLPELTRAYPEETRVTAPIETWSDDFSIAIAGIPSMVNDFTGGSFMETHYHSQFDNDDFYDEQVYRLHHELFALLIPALDETAVVPLNFAPVFRRCAEAAERQQETTEAAERFLALCQEAEEAARKQYCRVAEVNRRYRSLLLQNRQEEAEQLFEETRELERRLLEEFKAEQDALVRIDWYGNVMYPQELLLQNRKRLRGALRNLQEGDLSSAMRKLYQVDNNAYAFMFEEEVYRHFTDYVFCQPRERLKWGFGRLPEHENMYPLVRALLTKQAQNDTNVLDEMAYVRRLCDRQETMLEQVYEELSEFMLSEFMQKKTER